jgi:alpha-beta hydrolase superfamily lysophospholipase
MSIDSALHSTGNGYIICYFRLRRRAWIARIALSGSLLEREILLEEPEFHRIYRQGTALQSSQNYHLVPVETVPAILRARARDRASAFRMEADTKLGKVMRACDLS